MMGVSATVEMDHRGPTCSRLLPNDKLDRISIDASEKIVCHGAKSNRWLFLEIVFIVDMPYNGDNQFGDF